MGHIECTSIGWKDLAGSLGGDRVLVIAPGIQKATTVRHTLTDVLSNVSVVTLDELVREITDSASPGIREISLTATKYIVRSILEDLREDLEYLAGVLAFPGTASAVTRCLLDTIDSCPDVVSRGFASAFGSGRPDSRERDMILVGDEFLRRMHAERVACADLIRALALRVLEFGECERVRALETETVVVDGIYHGPELYWRLLAALSRRASRTRVAVRTLSEEFDRASSVEGIRASLLHARLEDRLVSAMRGRWVHRFDTRDGEVQGVARQIARLLRDDPSLDPSQIGVIIPNLDRYQALVEEYFDAYGLPCEFAGGFPLKASPIASVARTLLSQAQTPGDRAGMFRLLSSGLIDAGEIDVQLVDRLARRFNISDLAALKETLETMPTGFLPEGDERVSLESSMDALLSLIGDLRTLAGKTDSLEFADAFISCLSRLRVAANAVFTPWLTPDGAEDAIDSFPRDEWSRRNACALSALVDAIADVRDTLLLFGSDDSLSLEDLVQVVEDALRDRRYRCRPIKEAVRVMSPHEARGVDLSHCFVLGLVEGEFPALPDRGFLLQRPVEWNERCREAAHFLLDVLYGSQHVWLSTFTSDGSSRLAVSPLFKDLQHVVDQEVAAAQQGGDLDDCADFEMQAAVGLALTQNRPDALARFLQSCDASHCLEQLRMEICRESEDIGGVYDGEVQPQLLDLGDRVYSVTQLETYIRCPFLYMARYILGIEPLEEADDELESSEMGSLIHDVLSQFGRTGGFRLVKSDPEGARRLLLEVTQSAFGTAALAGRQNLFVKVQYERLVDGLEHGKPGFGLLRRFLDAEEERVSSVIPKSFEQDFQFIIEPPPKSGLSGQHASAKIRGKIDRVDVSEDGSMCFVIDYKTGQMPSIPDITKGFSLQLPVYLMALTSSDRSSGALSGVSGYCHLPSAGPVRISRVFGDLEVLPEVLTRSAEKWDIGLSQVGGWNSVADRILDICSRIRSGRFATTRLDEGRAGCRYCELSRICRHDPIDSIQAGLQSDPGGES